MMHKLGGYTDLRVIAFQLGSIGDTVVSIPALRAVRRHYGSRAKLFVLHEVRSDVKVTPADILSESGEADEFIGYYYSTDFWGRTISMARLWRMLRQHRFQAVVYLAPSERSAIRVRRDEAFFRLCGIPDRLGFHAFPRDVLYPTDAKGRPARVVHEALCRLERLRLAGIDVSIESNVSRPFLRLPWRAMQSAKEWLAYNRKFPHRKLVAISPGSKQPANLWPLERFIEIGQRLQTGSGYELVVVGGESDRLAGDRMVTAWGDGLNATGKFAVLESAAILAHCSFIVGLDTGTTHLAAALGVPCVALYGGRENPGRFEPLGKGHIILRHPVECANCRLIMTPCPIKEHPCMSGISVDDVWQAVLQIAGTPGEVERGSPTAD